MRSTELTWKRGLGLLGTLGIAAAAVALTHTSSPNCGYRLLDRWSVPFLVLVGLVGGLGIAMLVVAVLTSENIARQIVRRLLAVGLSVGLTLGAIDVNSSTVGARRCKVSEVAMTRLTPSPTNDCAERRFSSSDARINPHLRQADPGARAHLTNRRSSSASTG